MKKMRLFGVLLVSAALLTACDKKTSEEEGQKSQIEYFAFQEEEDGPWGLMTTDGTVLVKPKFYGDVSPVVNERFYVGNDGEYTIYTGEKNPKKIGTYKNCGSFTSDLCPVQDKDDNVFFIDKDGKKVLDVNIVDGKKVKAVYNFFCGRAMINTEDEKWGFIDESGKAVIPIKYADAWNFCEDLAIIYLDTPTYDDDDTGKWCVIDTEGNKLFTKRFCDMKPSEYRFSDGLLEVTDSDNNYMLIDKEGNVVQKIKEHCFTNYIHDGVFTVYNTETSKVGLMDKDGEWLIRPKFSSLQFNGKLLVGSVEEEEYALYTMEGEKIADLPHGYVNLFEKEYKDYDSYLLVGSWEDGYQLVDAEGNEVETKYPIHGYSTGYNWGFSTESYEEGDCCEEDFSDEEYGDEDMD